MKKIFLLFAALLTGCILIQRGVPPTDGVVNFGRINERVLRGAQPDERALDLLAARHGVKTIINLRQANDVWPSEEPLARARGIIYLNLPFHGFSAPTDHQITEVLTLIEQSPPPVFLHCEHGADRTGTVIACYRIQHDHWSAQAALTEADHYGMSIFEFGMRNYVRGFGR